MTEPIRITPPLDDETLRSLRGGMRVLVTGEIIGARDQAHLRMIEALGKGDALPFDPAGAVIYYVGPTPGGASFFNRDEQDGQDVRRAQSCASCASLLDSDVPRAVGAAGPTTSSRMDGLCETLFAAGVKATIGKGPRTGIAKESMKRHGAIYLAATGGAGALLGARIEKAEIIAYDDLGPEALRRLTVRDFPAVVAIDLEGRDLFEEGPSRWSGEVLQQG